MFSYFLLFLNIFLSVGGQFMFKFGVNSLNIPFNLINLPKVITNPYIFSAFFLYGLSSVLWIFVLKQVPLSIAYPTLSLGYILILFVSNRYLGETVTYFNLIGVLLIVLGVRLLFVK